MKIEKSVRDRFFSLVEKQDNGCWLWMGTRDKKGYGHFCLHKRRYMSHRFMWEVIHGRTIPEGYELHHKCRQRGCVRLRHLQIVSHSENMKLAQQMGVWRGELNGRAKRSQEDIHVIRSLRHVGVPVRHISALMDLPGSSCYAVFETGGSWKHLKTPTRYILLKLYQTYLDTLAHHVLVKRVRPPDCLVKSIQFLLPKLQDKDLQTVADIMFHQCQKLPQ